MSTKLNEVQQRLSEIDATKFHKMVDTYLNKKYNYSIHSTGTKTGEDKPRKGTPDTLITLDNGEYIFVEYTAQKTKVKDKFLDDIEKCLDSKKTGISIQKIAKIIIACNSSLQVNDIEALRLSCGDIECEVLTNSTLSYDFVNHFPSIAKEFLGIDIGNILTPNVLKEKYLTDFKTISLLTTNTQKPIDEIFINLAIIKDKKEEQKQDKQLNREALLNSYEEIHKPKEPIEIKELINTAKKSLIYGKAGIGKTTLCKYIAYMWANSKLYNEFEFVVYIPLREWKTDGLKGAIKDYYYSHDIEKLTIDIASTKMLFLFDGYDELDSERKKLLRDEIDKYNLIHYIITTRPYGYQKNDFSIDEQFKTIGFTDENVEQYIEAFFKETKKSEDLKAYLQSNISIKHIAYIPLMLEMICSLWEEKEFSDSFTMTELYSNVIEDMLSKHSASKDDERIYKRKNRKKIKEQLGKIAFEGLINQTILLDGDLIENSINDIDFFEENVIYSGFLKSDVKEKDFLDNNFEFPHLTFQEYFSALYVDSLSKEEQSEIIRDWKFYPHMQMFFAFLGGLIEDKEFLLREIESEPRDLVGLQEFNLLLICISEMKKIEENRKSKLSNLYFDWLSIFIKNPLFGGIRLRRLDFPPILIDDNFLNKILDIIKDGKVNNAIKEMIANKMIYLASNNIQFIKKLIDVIKNKDEDTITRKIIATGLEDNKIHIKEDLEWLNDYLWEEFEISVPFGLYDNMDKLDDELDRYSILSKKKLSNKATDKELEECSIKFTTLKVLLEKYTNKEDDLKIIMKNSFYRFHLIYFKNNKLHTIENGKEISTQREVNKETLNKITMLIKREDLND